MQAGQEFYSKNLNRMVHPNEDVYLIELKHKLLEKISFYRNAGCGTAGCNLEEQSLRNELHRVNSLLDLNNES